MFTASAIRRRLLEHNPTPSLAETLSFVQRYRAIEHHNPPTSTSTTTEKPSADVNQLVGLMTEVAARQKALEDQVALSQQLYAAAIKQQDQLSPKATGTGEHTFNVIYMQLHLCYTKKTLEPVAWTCGVITLKSCPRTG